MAKRNGGGKLLTLLIVILCALAAAGTCSLVMYAYALCFRKQTDKVIAVLPVYDRTAPLRETLGAVQLATGCSQMVAVNMSAQDGKLDETLAGGMCEAVCEPDTLGDTLLTLLQKDADTRADG